MYEVLILLGLQYFKWKLRREGGWGGGGALTKRPVDVNRGKSECSVFKILAKMVLVKNSKSFSVKC